MINIYNYNLCILGKVHDICILKFKSTPLMYFNNIK